MARFNSFLKAVRAALDNSNSASPTKQEEMSHPLPELMLNSGFSPIPPKVIQRVYKGMSDEQARPFFRLLQTVGDVDIIKFYQDSDKNHFVRFQIDGEQFDLPTTSGLGVSIMGPLNTLIFEKGIPYQFVIFNKNGQAGRIQMGYVPWQAVRITLVNKATYEKYKSFFLNGSITGFAATDYPTEDFIKNIKELKKLVLNSDLDQIDLMKDPKFLTIREQLGKLSNYSIWAKLLTQCLKYPLDRKPSKTWQNKATTIIESFKKEEFQNGHLALLEQLIIGDEWFNDTEKLSALRGLTWLCRIHTGQSQLYLLQKIANKAYKKVPGGPMNAKLGNIALETLADIGTMDAFGIINNIEAKAKYTVYKRAIASRKKKFTKLLKAFSPEELADRSVPTHSLVDGGKIMIIGDSKAHLKMDGFIVNTSWETPNGKVQKSVPASLKVDYSAEIKAVKTEAKSILETLNSQAKRLEKSWLSERIWGYQNWVEFIFEHALMRIMAERLVWIMKTEEQSVSFMIHEGELVDEHGSTIDLSEDATIQLWHPALVSTEETLAWRNRIFDQQIKQPFKQAFREVYLLTPAEENTFDFSNRFSGHYLRGNTLYSLGKNREWTMTYEEPPVLKLPDGKLIAVLNINGGVLYSECTTLDLHFRKKSDPKAKNYGHYNLEKVALKDVPSVILSEVMRDVDLFVAVAGMGIDPYFDQSQTGDRMNYWRDASFGVKSQTALSEIRKDLLERLLPKTKLAGKYSFVANFLRIEGQQRTYKINLGSGNILMEPNNQYLCIVPAHDKRLEKRVWLPFEGGDRTLTTILSKAFLLAEDDKITDSTILAQINRRR